MADPADLPHGLLAALGVATLERGPDGHFAPLGALPDWFGPFFHGAPGPASGAEPPASGAEPPASGETNPDASGARGPVDLGAASDFLAHFLPEAEAAWASGHRRMSGPFAERGADGEEHTLEATALLSDGRPLLLLGPPTMTFATTQRLLQTARDERLDVERTQRRTEEREVLLHCIVHDLANPLAGIRGGLRMLDASGLSDDDRELVAIARRQADRMQAMIGDVLDTFRREVDAMMPATAAPADTADALRQSAEALSPRAALAGVALHTDAPEAPLRAVADARRLERVVMNLTENAIRHSPEGGAVRLSAQASGGDVLITVDDDGPGVAPEAVADLFRRFRPRGPKRGQSGLGLYFCRLAAESWGGSVGYEPRPGGGARFWVRLRRARAPLAEGGDTASGGPT